MAESNAGIEFDRQLDNLAALGYPSIRDAERLRQAAIEYNPAGIPDVLPFVLVATQQILPAAESIGKVTLAGKSKPGRIDRNYADGELATFAPREDLDVPSSPAYLIFDVERGEEFRNVRPEEATATIFARNRTPLTVDEGIAVVTAHPAILEKNKCFMLAGSRNIGRKVPALWISEGAPKLGWCWNGNPHTWLGTASCSSRCR
ncbi:MAG TPA: DUF5701 family protein [Mycobacteriales bacterium]|jgi:hypothetical protein|nr:DUF5701 family protein [Mycobacteriales bacterium]